ncbi:MAG: 16S rRNA (cytidine(1402)-2'-O)-methyltransferase [Balneolaceae bacterium]
MIMAIQSIPVSVLYLVATPIGNLDDFSHRAIEILKNADRIACEDTRTSSRLLKQYDIRKPLFSFHQHNEHRKVENIMEMLDNGEVVALISDAGMPGISDPGFLAVRAAHQRGHTVQTIPGPDACTTALVTSGLPSDRYLFEGFLPPKKGRQTRLQEIAERDVTTVLYESPHRLLKLLDELLEHAGPDRLACVAKELTKTFEETDRAPLGELQARWHQRESIKGEYVVIVSGKTYSE